MYVLSGWEVLAHDAKVLQDALTRNSNQLKVWEGIYFPYDKKCYVNLCISHIYIHSKISGKLYLVDCGYANHRNFWAPYRSTRYHLQEFRGQGKDPVNQNELFNQSSFMLEKCSRRNFGIFKSRFLIFKCASLFPFKTQAELVLACCFKQLSS